MEGDLRFHQLHILQGFDCGVRLICHLFGLLDDQAQRSEKDYTARPKQSASRNIVQSGKYMFDSHVAEETKQRSGGSKDDEGDLESKH